MDILGLVRSITEATAYIDAGRKGFATKGKAEEGRISYEKGISQAMTVFKETQATVDPQTIILAEYTFLTQELEFCHEKDKASRTSLTAAIQSFDDAFLAYKIVEEKTQYHVADKVIPHHKDYRVSGGYPKDSLHVACSSHKARLGNIQKSPGIDPIEKDLLQQRLDNLPVAQSSYIGKQREALENL